MPKRNRHRCSNCGWDHREKPWQSGAAQAGSAWDDMMDYNEWVNFHSVEKYGYDPSFWSRSSSPIGVRSSEEIAEDRQFWRRYVADQRIGVPSYLCGALPAQKAGKMRKRYAEMELTSLRRKEIREQCPGSDMDWD